MGRVEEEEVHAVCDEIGADYLSSSALTGEGVETLFLEMVRTMIKDRALVSDDKQEPIDVCDFEEVKGKNFFTQCCTIS